MTATMQATTTPVIRLGSEGERLSFMGYEIVFKSPHPTTGGDWMAIEYTLGPRQNGAPLHYHRELIESFYIMEGQLWMRAGSQEVMAGPGSYILVPAGTPHAFGNQTDAPVRILAHASNRAHKDFLTELFDMAREEQAWPPRDPARLIELGGRYDSYYL